jgi:hypothetical protein
MARGAQADACPRAGAAGRACAGARQRSPGARAGCGVSARSTAAAYGGLWRRIEGGNG